MDSPDPTAAAASGDLALDPPPPPAAVPAADRRGDDACRRAAVRVDRAAAELRRGRMLLVGSAPHDAGAAWLLVAAVEMLVPALLQSLLQAGAVPRLVLTAERLQALGWTDAAGPQALELPPSTTLARLQELAAAVPGGADRSAPGEDRPADAAMLAALALCKRARLLPALVVVPAPAALRDALDAEEVLRFDPEDLALAMPAAGPALRRVSDAHVPLAAHDDCTLVVFRELGGDAEHLAIVVGRPPAAGPVPVRLHSACLTGDLLGSLRCDCGPQLQRAVARLARTGGVLLYLAQEGRGTGLANKLRAYRLQDAGLDTLQADRYLGFRADERDYRAAATMLRELGFPRIRLLTNNPHKIEALRAAGIDVADRQPLHAPVNRHNARYVNTKRLAGHLGRE